MRVLSIAQRCQKASSSLHLHHFSCGAETSPSSPIAPSQKIKTVNFVNRAAIVVRPKEPFFDWARSLEGGLPENTKPWSSVYLVDRDAKDDPKKIVSRNYSAIFEEQLEGWLRVPDDWPAPRTLSLFEKWFDAQVADMVLDLSYRALRHDE